MTDALSQVARLLTTFAVALALVWVGYAHNTTQAHMPPDLAEYVAIGGSLDDLCGETDAPHHGHTVSCEACRITDLVLLCAHMGVGTFAAVL